MIYQMTPIASGTRLRKDHNTFAGVITSYGKSNLIQGDELWIAPADGNEVKKNDKWLHVTHVDNSLLPEAGWMAYIHKGVPICGNFVEIPDVPPPDPNPEPKPEQPVFPSWFILTDPHGNRAKYTFVEIIVE